MIKINAIQDKQTLEADSMIFRSLLKKELPQNENDFFSKVQHLKK